ncbi:hypothetical protein BDZ91DRAFT_498403 [Kalaharituber pfeilii]|nr:hypothetical protein BDZ91DRAFT_498403 [Kalaharituber pfeilii]
MPRPTSAGIYTCSRSVAKDANWRFQVHWTYRDNTSHEPDLFLSYDFLWSSLAGPGNRLLSLTDPQYARYSIKHRDWILL